MKESANDFKPDELAIQDRVPTLVYTFLTVTLFTLQIVFAILIDDITLIFGFFAAIAETVYNFILPGLFCLISSRIAGKKCDLKWTILSYLFIAIGTVFFIASNIRNIQKILS